MEYRGRVWKFEDHVNTDDIIAARYLNTTGAEELARHCFETIRPDFAAGVKPGDIIVAGENFGCGSSREHAAIAIKGCQVSLVIAGSFARIFLRNSINTGLPLIELSQADQIQEGDELEVDLENGQIRNLTRKQDYTFGKYPQFLQEIIESGGLMQWVKRKYIKSA